MSRSLSLLEKLKENVNELDAAEVALSDMTSIEITTEEQADEVENLYKKIFKLSMSNSGIYEDLLLSLEKEEEFTKRRLLAEANKLLRVAVVDV